MSASSASKCQPGDRNAFRQGLDSPSFTQVEMQNLDEKEESDLQSEIALTRFILARLLYRMHTLKEKKSAHIP